MRSEAKFSLHRMVLLAVVIGMFATLAQASPSASGTFTLSTEAHWGKSVLPAGTYQYSLDDSAPYHAVIVRNVEGGNGVIVLPQSVSQGDWRGKSALVLSRASGEMFVTSFSIRELGVVLHYGMVEAEKRTMAARAK
jgi:hypothetical protein